jgi:hypothetical protein
MATSTHDLGGSRGRTPTTIGRLAPFVIAAVIASFASLVWLYVKDRSDKVAEAAAETNVAAIVGPPCPAITPQIFKAHQLETRSTFDFNGLSLSRRFGNVSCGVAATHDALGIGAYPVCQFSSPDVLAIKTAKGTYLFEPGVGKKATVMLRGGAVSCVMAAPYWN